MTGQGPCVGKDAPDTDFRTNLQKPEPCCWWWQGVKYSRIGDIIRLDSFGLLQMALISASFLVLFSIWVSRNWNAAAGQSVFPQKSLLIKGWKLTDTPSSPISTSLWRISCERKEKVRISCDRRIATHNVLIVPLVGLPRPRPPWYQLCPFVQDTFFYSNSLNQGWN